MDTIYKYRSQTLNISIANVFFIVMIALCIYLKYYHPIDVAEGLQNWSIAHIILHSIPIYIYIKKFDKQQTNFPFIETFAIFNILHYGLPGFFIKTFDFQLGNLDLTALIVTFYAHLIFYASYYFFRQTWKIRPIEFIPSKTSVLPLKAYAYVTLIIYIISYFFRDSFIYQIGYVGFYIFVGFFINFWKDGYLNRFEKIIFVPIIIQDIIVRAGYGIITPLALLLFFIALCIVISKSNRIFIAIGLAFFVWFYTIFTPIKAEFRTKTWYEVNDYTMLDKLVLIQDLYNQEKKKNTIAYIDNYPGKKQFLWRFSYQLSTMSMVINKTPDIVPYWKGVSYLPLITKFIPRVFWSNKPEENMGYVFGVTYGVISSNNTRTAINTPIIPELYINFGYQGVYIGCILLGILYSVLTRLFNSNKVSYSSKIIGMALIFPLVIWESNFSLIFGSLLLVTIILILIFKMIIGVLEK